MTCCCDFTFSILNARKSPFKDSNKRTASVTRGRHYCNACNSSALRLMATATQHQITKKWCWSAKLKTRLCLVRKKIPEDGVFKDMNSFPDPRSIFVFTRDWIMYQKSDTQLKVVIGTGGNRYSSTKGSSIEAPLLPCSFSRTWQHVINRRGSHYTCFRAV